MIVSTGEILWSSWIGVFLAATTLVAPVVRHRLNALRSPLFFNSLLFLAVFYGPQFILGYPYIPQMQYVVLLGLMGVQAGSLVGSLRLRPNLAEPKLLQAMKWFRLPDGKYLLFLYALGMAGYTLLYLVRGIPVLAGNVAYAREAFISGAGAITWPSAILINFSVWAFAIRDSTKRAMLLGGIALGYMMLSGWRGSLIIMGLSLLFIMAARKRITIVAFGWGLAGLSGLALLGILRASMAGASLYSIQIDDIHGWEQVLQVIGYYLFARTGEHAVNMQDAISYFDGRHLNGRGILMDLSFLLPGKNQTIENYMKDMFAGWSGGGGMPVTMFGAFFADFGAVGVLVMSFLSAALYAAIWHYVLRCAKSKSEFYVFAGIVGTAWFYSFMGSFFNYFITFIGMYFVGFIALAWFYIAVLRSLGTRRTRVLSAPSAVR